MDSYSEADNEGTGVKLCNECGKRFLNISNLRRHARQMHPEKLQEIAPLFYKNKANFSFSCDICNKNFNIKSHLRHHMKKHIPEDAPLDPDEKPLKPSKKCPLCSFATFKAVELQKHFEEVHEITINSKDMEFTSLQDFEKWMKSIEKKTQSKFVKKGTRSFKDHTTTKYICHRAGHYIPRGKGLRNLKVKGSSKINGYCPAGIKLIHYNNGLCYIHNIETHVGHSPDNNLEYLPLTKEDREQIASQIANKVPFEDILDGIRNSSSNSDVERIHLISRKDLYNIQKSFNLSSDLIKSSIDEISLESWVNELKNDNDCVIFYKPQGIVMDDHPLFENEDFILMIMTSVQCELLNKYGEHCICLDRTLSVNGYNFELHTLLILDDISEGLPCAFCISNRSDQEVFKLFFWSIKEQTGIIQTKIFMSDVNDSYFNAWKYIMGVPEERLFCLWHLDYAWKMNLKKIKSKEKQVIIYKKLRALLKEKDSSVFIKMINSFCEVSAEDPETKDFSKFFIDTYSANFDCWAHSYRLHSRINTNLHLERIHKTMKNIFLKGKNAKRIDVAISEIMRCFREKLIERIFVVNKGKYFFKYLQSRHHDSLALNTDIISTSEDGWVIQSQTNQETYLIQEVNQTCNCDIMCTECNNTCIHRYYCSCIDSCIKFNLCKHIHLLASWRKQSVQNNEIEGEDYVDNYIIQIDNHSNDNESEMIVHIAKRKLEEEKEELKKQVCSYLDAIQLPEELELAKKMLAPLSLPLSTVEMKLKPQTFITTDITNLTDQYITYEPTNFQSLHQI